MLVYEVLSHMSFLMLNLRDGNGFQQPWEKRMINKRAVQNWHYSSFVSVVCYILTIKLFSYLERCLKTVFSWPL